MGLLREPRRIYKLFYSHLFHGLPTGTCIQRHARFLPFRISLSWSHELLRSGQTKCCSVLYLGVRPDLTLQKSPKRYLLSSVSSFLGLKHYQEPYKSVQNIYCIVAPRLANSLPS